MITGEVRVWLDKVKRGEYSYEDAMYEFRRFAYFLTTDEIKFIKSKIQESCEK